MPANSKPAKKKPRRPVRLAAKSRHPITAFKQRDWNTLCRTVRHVTRLQSGPHKKKSTRKYTWVVVCCVDGPTVFKFLRAEEITYGTAMKGLENMPFNKIGRFDVYNRPPDPRVKCELDDTGFTLFMKAETGTSEATMKEVVKVLNDDFDKAALRLDLATASRHDILCRMLGDYAYPVKFYTTMKAVGPHAWQTSRRAERDGETTEDVAGGIHDHDALCTSNSEDEPEKSWASDSDLEVGLEEDTAPQFAGDEAGEATEAGPEDEEQEDQDQQQDEGDEAGEATEAGPKDEDQEDQDQQHDEGDSDTGSGFTQLQPPALPVDGSRPHVSPEKEKQESHSEEQTMYRYEMIHTTSETPDTDTYTAMSAACEGDTIILDKASLSFSLPGPSSQDSSVHSSSLGLHGPPLSSQESVGGHSTSEDQCDSQDQSGCEEREEAGAVGGVESHAQEAAPLPIALARHSMQTKARNEDVRHVQEDKEEDDDSEGDEEEDDVGALKDLDEYRKKAEKMGEAMPELLYEVDLDTILSKTDGQTKQMYLNRQANLSQALHAVNKKQDISNALSLLLIDQMRKGKGFVPALSPQDRLVGFCEGATFSGRPVSANLPWKTVEQMKTEAAKMEHDDGAIASVMCCLQGVQVHMPPSALEDTGHSGEAADSTKARKEAKKKANDDFWTAMRLEVTRHSRKWLRAVFSKELLDVVYFPVKRAKTGRGGDKKTEVPEWVCHVVFAFWTDQLRRHGRLASNASLNDEQHQLINSSVQTGLRGICREWKLKRKNEDCNAEAMDDDDQAKKNPKVQRTGPRKTKKGGQEAQENREN